MKEFKINEIENKRILGRTGKNDGNTNAPLALFWGASALEINVKAKEVWVEFSSDYVTNEPWVTVQINGFETQRFVVPKGESKSVCVAFNLNPQKENLISIIKDTQAMAGDAKHILYIKKVCLDDEAQFLPLKPRSLNIEFIGDSITSGEGLAGNPDEMDWISQWMSASKTYAMKTAKALNANWSAVSQCGWGLCWGWDGNPDSNIAKHYDKVCSLLDGDLHKSLGSTEPYSFGQKMDYVILNLGTNDNSAFVQPVFKDSNGNEHPVDKNIIPQAAASFLQNIRKHNPDAVIIWTFGMMTLDVFPPLLKQGFDSYIKSSGDKKAFLLELDSMDKIEMLPEDHGSRGHPGALTHKKAAEKITAFIKNFN